MATSPSLEPSTGPGAAAGPFRVVGDAPVIVRGMVPGRSAILPGAVAADEAGFHAWVIAFGDAPGTQDVHHLTSPDGVAWAEAGDASLEGLSQGFGNPGAMPMSVVHVGDAWVMYLVGTLASERQGWDLWRATAPSADGPWTRSEAPVLRRGPAGAWDSQALDFPTVLPTDDGYLMVHSGVDAAHPEGGAIGVATSADGIAWTKVEGPVLEPGLCGGFDERAVHQPRVLVDGDRLVMAYVGYAGALESRGSVGLAESADGGMTWTCLWPGPALDAGSLPAGFVHTQVAFRRGDTPALLVEWFANGGTDVWLFEADELP